jgi:hypothetical protein
VINRWKEFCGESEPLIRVDILSQIQLGYFSEESYSDPYTMDMIILYIDRLELSQEKNYHQIYEYYKISLGFIPLKSDFDLLTIVWAESLLNNKDLTPAEKAFCLLYSNQFDEFWKYVSGDSIAGTALKKMYTEKVNSTKRMVDGNFGILAGIYLPTGNLNTVIGPKSIMGLQFGMKIKKVQYDLTIALRPGSSKQTYEVFYKNEHVQTDHYLGGYVGFDTSYELRNNFKTEIDLLGGIAFDGFDAIESDLDNDIDGKSLNSLNLNVGLGYRIYSKRMNYLGIQARYNFVNYNNKKGTNLDGNYLSLILTYNLFGNIKKHDALKKMHLK